MKIELQDLDSDLAAQNDNAVTNEQQKIELEALFYKFDCEILKRYSAARTALSMNQIDKAEKLKDELISAMDNLVSHNQKH